MGKCFSCHNATFFLLFFPVEFPSTEKNPLTYWYKIQVKWIEANMYWNICVCMRMCRQWFVYFGKSETNVIKIKLKLHLHALSLLAIALIGSFFAMFIVGGNVRPTFEYVYVLHSFFVFCILHLTRLFVLLIISTVMLLFMYTPFFFLSTIRTANILLRWWK